jgi:hypothetical protein
MRPRNFRPELAVVALALGVGVCLTTAGERPHKWRGTGQFVSATDFVAKGRATHLGKFDEVGRVTAMTPTDEPGVFAIEGWAIHTSANGDQLHEVFSGQLNFLTGSVTASIQFVGGTGRFADATGSATLSAQILAGGSIEFAGEGTIEH